MTAPPTLTATMIPCCECGTPILPNAANQCSSCLAQEFNLAARLQRGPAGAPHITIRQCRKCRRYHHAKKSEHRTNKGRYEYCDPESPELLALCLKHIPALSNNSEPRLHLVDAGWIWTEPHSMRFKLRLTVRTELQQVMVQQRVMVELHVAFEMCSDCNREYTSRTWHALVQLRQRRGHDHGAPKKGLAALEMALAKNRDIRKHVLRIDTAKNGFDFYFLTLAQAQAFTAFLQRVAPMRCKTSQKLVSADVKNNTAHIKYTTTCDMVPLCRDDLILIHKAAKSSKLAGRLVLATKVSNTLQLMDASPKRVHLASSQMDLSADSYYKNEKYYSVLQSSHRMIRFVVLDVELCEEPTAPAEPAQDATTDNNGNNDNPLYQGPQSGVTKYALADVQVARESDFGVNDEVFSCVSHLGHLIAPGDVVLGYDLVATVGGMADWELEESFHNSFVLPDVVLVKKVSGSASAAAAPAAAAEPQKNTTKKRERRKRRKEGKKMKELEESAVRMGFLEDDEDEQQHAFDSELAEDPQLAAELTALEQDLAALGTTEAKPTEEETMEGNTTDDKEANI